MNDLWDDVVGQDEAVTRLQASAASPLHAYLLVGPEGSGKRAAARAFAADLLSAGLDDDAAAVVARQVAKEQHPALSFVDRVGASLSRDQVRAVVVAAQMAPPVGDLQVVVLDEFHLAEDAAPVLLKTLEEPPPSTVLVLLAEELPESMATIASRCVQVDFGAVAESVIRDRLERDGVAPEVAATAAAGAGGSLTQARLLSHDPGAQARRDLWYSVPDRFDGTGSTAVELVDELRAATDELARPLTEAQAEALAEFDERAEVVGGGVAGERKALVDRHKREQKRVRTADLRAGLSALLTRYRDAVTAGAAGDDDRDPAGDYVVAATAVQSLCDALPFNPNEALQLQALLLSLPRPGVGVGSIR